MGVAQKPRSWPWWVNFTPALVGHFYIGGDRYGGEIRQGGISVGPALVCRGTAVLPVDDQPTASGMVSRAGDEPVSLPLAGGVVI